MTAETTTMPLVHAVNVSKSFHHNQVLNNGGKVRLDNMAFIGNAGNIVNQDFTALQTSEQRAGR